MAAAAVEPTVAPEETPRVERAEDLPEPVRADIVARRQAGETLAELKTRFTHVAPEVIREVLPPASKREADQRERKARTTRTKPRTGEEAAKASKPVGGKKAEAPKPKPAPAPRYATDKDLVNSLAERTVAARQVMGRERHGRGPPSPRVRNPVEPKVRRPAQRQEVQAGVPGDSQRLASCRIASTVAAAAPAAMAASSAPSRSGACGSVTNARRIALRASLRETPYRRARASAASITCCSPRSSTSLRRWNGSRSGGRTRPSWAACPISRLIAGRRHV